MSIYDILDDFSYDAVDAHIDAERSMERKRDRLLSQLSPKERKLLEQLEERRKCES